MRKPQKIVQWRFAFFLTLLVALNARFIGLDSDSITLAELTTLDAALRPLPELLSPFDFATSENSPLFNLLLHAWTTLIPETVFGLRALAALLSFTAIFPLFGISRILFNKRISYAATGFYAVSSLAVGIAQSISPLSLFMQFSLMSTWALLMMVRRHHKRFRLFYIATIMGALFTHPAVWFLIIFHHLVAFGSFFHKDNRHLTWKNWFAIEAILVLIIFLTFPENLPTIELPFERGWSTPLLALGQYIFAQAGSALLLLGTVGLMYQLFFNAKRYHTVFHTFPQKVMFLLLWFSIVTIPPLLFSFIEGQFGRANGSVVGLFPFLLLISCAIDTFEHRKRRMRVIAVVLLLSIWNLYNKHNDQNSSDWQGITAYAVEKSANAAVIIGESKQEPIFQFYNDDQITGTIVSLTEQEMNNGDWVEHVDESIVESDSLHLFFHNYEKEGALVLNHIQNDFAILTDTLLTERGHFNLKQKNLRYLFMTRKEQE